MLISFHAAGYEAVRTTEAEPTPSISELKWHFCSSCCNALFPLNPNPSH